MSPKIKIKHAYPLSRTQRTIASQSSTLFAEEPKTNVVSSSNHIDFLLHSSKVQVIVKGTSLAVSITFSRLLIVRAACSGSSAICTPSSGPFL
jgi:hypothetical protein